ncbi:hypothetical protein D3C78_1502710 [compost metagenome]
MPVQINRPVWLNYRCVKFEVPFPTAPRLYVEKGHIDGTRANIDHHEIVGRIPVELLRSDIAIDLCSDLRDYRSLHILIAHRGITRL